MSNVALPTAPPPPFPPYPTYPPHPPIRLGEPWIVWSTAAILSAFLTGSLILFAHQRKHLGSPDSLAGAGTVCGTSRTHVLAFAAFRALNLLWFATLSVLEWEHNIRLAGEQDSLTFHRSWLPASYTLMCFALQPFYWVFALLTSLLHLGSAKPSSAGAKLVRTCHWYLLEVCLPSSWLVTITVFLLISPLDLSIVYNDAAHAHFWNTVALTADFCANRLPIRAGHFGLMLVWMLIYVVYSWVRKASTWLRFVYWFQSLETPLALLWHPLLGILHVGIYASLTALSRCKLRHVDRGGCCSPCLYHTLATDDEQEPSKLATTEIVSSQHA